MFHAPCLSSAGAVRCPYNADKGGVPGSRGGSEGRQCMPRGHCLVWRTRPPPASATLQMYGRCLPPFSGKFDHTTEINLSVQTRSPQILPCNSWVLMETHVQKCKLQGVTIIKTKFPSYPAGGAINTVVMHITVSIALNLFIGILIQKLLYVSCFGISRHANSSQPCLAFFKLWQQLYIVLLTLLPPTGPININTNTQKESRKHKHGGASLLMNVAPTLKRLRGLFLFDFFLGDFVYFTLKTCLLYFYYFSSQLNRVEWGWLRKRWACGAKSTSAKNLAEEFSLEKHCRPFFSQITFAVLRLSLWCCLV